MNPIAEARTALMLLTRLPVPGTAVFAADLPARAMAWYPVVGVLVGALAGAGFALMRLIGAPPLPSALVALAIGVLATGGLHEDGLTDTADGFGGGRDTAHKLAIMHDSRIGSYGAMALILTLGLRASCLAALDAPLLGLMALIAAGAWSRAVLPALILLLPSARVSGVGASQGRPTRGRVCAGLVLGVAVAGALAGAVPVAVATVAVLAFAWLAQRQIGGYTGDVLGAAQQVAEVTMLFVMVVLR
ncbi:MAG: adenosylcobinamide-GDP ribazoletransferase [Azospirillaceae bacterium]|nr:adenosylcobinamide-GDP ribazoletransferase [Azospirillaceae bacterium]